MNLTTLKSKLIIAKSAIDKAILADNFIAYQDIKQYYETAIDKIDAGEQISENELRRIGYGSRMLYEAPLANTALQNNILADMNVLETFLDENGY